MSASAINIRNKKASYQYEFIEKFVAGIQLMGTEIKSIRDGKASVAEAYCYLKKGEMFVKNMHIAVYEAGSYNNHEPLRERKLLLNRLELDRIKKKMDTKGLTIIPIALFINQKGLAKMEIALAKGKKLHDKRDDLKQKDAKRDIDRALKE